MRVPWAPVVASRAVVTALPLAVCPLCVMQVPGVGQASLRWSISWRPDCWGETYELSRTFWFMGAAMLVANLVLAPRRALSGRLCGAGLVHGVSRTAAPKVYAGAAEAVSVVACVPMATMLSRATSLGRALLACRSSRLGLK